MRYRQTVYILAGFVILALIVSSFIFFLKEPSITGNVITGQTFHEKDSEYNERLSLTVNESSTYTWSPENQGNLKSLKASGIMSTNGTAKVYIQKDGQKYILFDSTKHLFDIDIHVLPEYKKIYSGDEVLIQIVLFNLRGFGSGNVTVTYSIRDSFGNMLAIEKEEVFVETQAKFIRKLLMPPDINPGTYFAFVEVTSTEPLGSGSDTFEVISKFQINYAKNTRIYLVGLSSLVAVILVFMLIMSAYREHEKKKILTFIKEKGIAEKDDKMKNELRALEGAYQSKFISEESYIKQKERIEKKLNEGQNQD